MQVRLGDIFSSDEELLNKRFRFDQLKSVISYCRHHHKKFIYIWQFFNTNSVHIGTYIGSGNDLRITAYSKFFQNPLKYQSTMHKQKMFNYILKHPNYEELIYFEILEFVTQDTASIREQHYITQYDNARLWNVNKPTREIPTNLAQLLTNRKLTEWEDEESQYNGIPCRRCNLSITGGYPKIKICGHTYRYHRVKYVEYMRQKLNDPDWQIPSGLVVSHLCNNKWCIEPQHMTHCTEEKNHQWNTHNGDHPNQKLTLKLAKEIRKKYHDNESIKALAQQYDVSTAVISNLLNNISYRDETYIRQRFQTSNTGKKYISQRQNGKYICCIFFNQVFKINIYETKQKTCSTLEEAVTFRDQLLENNNIPIPD